VLFFFTFIFSLKTNPKTGDALQITPDVRSALRDCEDMFMPVLPFLCLPKTSLPPIFTEWSQGKSSLDNQVSPPFTFSQASVLSHYVRVKIHLHAL
jgi:hypothetical protein